MLFAFFRLIRLPNLFVVALTQALIYYRFIRADLLAADLVPRLSEAYFWQLCSLTMLVTAGGYIVNDMLDEESDAINRPGKNKVQLLGSNRCLWWYLMTVLLGFAISLSLAFSLGELRLLWLYPLSVTVLALYSRRIKTFPFAGNLVVAAYCAGVPLVLALAERDSLAALRLRDPQAAEELWLILLVYAAFATLATVLRELVKDLEDEQGDRRVGRRTLPIYLGIPISKGIAFGLVGGCWWALVLPWWAQWTPFLGLPVRLYLMALGAVLVLIAIRLYASKTQQDYRFLSSWLKYFLLAGLGLLLIL